MKPTDNTEDFVRRGKAKVATGPRMDKRVLDDSFAAMGSGRSSTVRILLRSRAIRLATAAVIAVATILLRIQMSPPGQEHPQINNVAKPPAEMLSMIALTMTYQQGGIEEVERQCDRAILMLGPRTTRISLGDLFEDLNGQNSKRTEL
jgi:hypothetical protein